MLAEVCRSTVPCRCDCILLGPARAEAYLKRPEVWSRTHIYTTSYLVPTSVALSIQ